METVPRPTRAADEMPRENGQALLLMCPSAKDSPVNGTVPDPPSTAPLHARRGAVLDAHAGSVTGLAFMLAKIKPNAVTGCWEWIGARDSRGYGNVRVRGRVRKAHRVIYEETRGSIPDGMECDHLCRVPWCVNPAHLELVAHAENVRRGAARWVPGARQRAKRRCPRGHAYTKSNTYVQPSTGGRACRACDRDRKRARAGRREALPTAYALAAPT